MMASGLLILCYSYLLLVCRASGLLLAGPLMLGPAAPRVVRVAMCITLAVYCSPQVAPVGQVPAHVLDLILMLGSEMLLGVLLGFSARLLFDAMQFAGQIIGTQIGFSIGSVLNPALDPEAPPTSMLLNLLASFVYLSIGGHQLLMHAFLTSIRSIPLGKFAFAPSLWEWTLTQFSTHLQFGVQVAMPMIAVLLLLLEMTIAFISRSVPSINFMTPVCRCGWWSACASFG